MDRRKVNNMADKCKRYSLLFYNVRSLAKGGPEEAKCMLEDIEAIMRKARCTIPGK